MAEKSSELEETTDAEKILTTGETALETRDEDAVNETETSVPDDEQTDETEQLREQIVETRRGMSETIDAIQEKLSFQNISEQVQAQVSEQISGAVETAKDVFYDKAGEVVNTVGRSFRQIGRSDLAKKAQQNPTTLALVGTGIGALLVALFVKGDKKSKKKSRSYKYELSEKNYSGVGKMKYPDESRHELKSSRADDSDRSFGSPTQDRAADKTSSIYESVSGAANSAYEGVTSAADSAFGSLGSAASKTYESVGSVAGKTYKGLSSAAGYTYDKAGDLGGQVKINYEHYIEENPLAVGAVALALGAAVGLAIPLTRKENEYLGEYRDQLVEKAQDAAQDAIGTVKQMATDAQKVIAEEVKSKTA